MGISRSVRPKTILFLDKMFEFYLVAQSIYFLIFDF